MQGAVAPQPGAGGQVLRHRLHPGRLEGCLGALRHLGPAGGHHVAEGGGPLQGDGEVAVEDALQDLVGHPAHLVGAGRVAGPGDDMVGLGEPDAGGVFPGGPVRIGEHPGVQHVEAPQCPGQRTCRSLGPQVGEGVQPDVVDERHQALGHRGVVGRPAGMQQDGGGLVGGVQGLDRVGPLAQCLQGGRGQEAGPAWSAVIGHPTRLGDGHPGWILYAWAP
ncbi:hypothetical protein SDC9_72617 [bioreactor metagenome]|uniref:Uncharacterized protein n=1 Tax=bioreactor metagenome TaxID=1076179 RepID=A0A644YC26_9ZZZZ